MFNADKYFIYNEYNCENKNTENFGKPRYISKYLWAYLCGATFWEDKYSDNWSASSLNDISRFQPPKYECILEVKKENKESEDFEFVERQNNFAKRKETAEQEVYTNCKSSGRKSINSICFDVRSNDLSSDAVKRKSSSTDSSSNTFCDISYSNYSYSAVTGRRSPSRLKSNKNSSTLRNSNYEVDWSEKQYETDPGILKRRQKQIDYGKSTKEYQEYLKAVPKDKRNPRLHIFTPKKHCIHSRRSWDAQIKIWRKKLHEWDPE